MWQTCRVRALRISIALGKGDLAEAAAVLKEAKRPFSATYARTHLGSLERFALMKAVFANVAQESSQAIPAELETYLTQIAEHLQTLEAAKAATAQSSAENAPETA